MSDGEDFEDAFLAHFRPRMREEKARAQRRKDERKHRTGQSRELRRLIKERGIIAVLHQCGVEDLNASAQFTLPLGSIAGSRSHRSNMSSREWTTGPSVRSSSVLLTRAATPGERQAALAAMNG